MNVILYGPYGTFINSTQERFATFLRHRREPKSFSQSQTQSFLFGGRNFSSL